MRLSFRHSLAIPALAFLIVPALSAQGLGREGAQRRYLPVDLGVLPGWTDSQAYDVNDKGHVTGVLRG
jgi:hypothetical protein